MRVGQSCLVRWQSEDSQTYMWYEAVIKSIEQHSVTVIWKDGNFKGYETDRIPFKWILSMDSHTERSHDIQSQILSRLNDIVSKMDILTDKFISQQYFHDDHATMESLSNSLEGLSSLEFSASNQRDFHDPNKKYHSYDACKQNNRYNKD